jgi:NADH-quinone oxidoreductase subunit H
MLLSIGIFGLKTLFFIFVFIWIRWTLPRFRYDQLMSLGWKFMLPLALAYIVIVASVMLALDFAGLERGIWYGLSMLGVNVVLVIITFFILDRGRIISPAYGRATPQQIARLRAVTAARSHLSPQSGD